MLIASRETPETFHFLEAKSDVPLKQEFKPSVTLLSRKPQLASRPSDSNSLESATTRIEQLGLNSQDVPDDSDEENSKPPEPTPEERQAMALRNLEEKQRKYEEVREKLFGSPSAPTSGSSTPRSATPPKQSEGRGKGKNRGGGRDNKNMRDSSTASTKSRQLYNPGNSPNPNPAILQREEQPQSRQPRNTRGSDGNWRGGANSTKGARG